MGPPSSIGDPQVVGLAQLLEDIRQGFILIPRFKRPFIWSVDQQIELLSSIRDGVPIGSILVWRTRTHAIACYDQIGRHRVQARSADPGGVQQYVLDGSQRLSTLYNALYQEDAAVTANDADDAGPRFYLDLRSRDFVAGGAEPDEKHLLPASILLNRMALLRRERRYNSVLMVDNAEEVFRAFDRYKIPVIPLVTEDFGLAIRSFDRINRASTPTSSLDFIHALTWSNDFDLLEQVNELKEQHLDIPGWDRLDDTTVLETCALMLGTPLHEEAAESIARDLRAKPETLEQAVERLDSTSVLLENASIFSPELVPYKRQLALLAAAMWSPFEPWPNVGITLLIAWLWLTAYAELFTGISRSRFQRIHESLQRSVRTGRLEWPGWAPFFRRPLPARYDFGSARGKALLLRLAEVTPQLPDGSPVQIQWSNGADYFRDAMAPMVPRKRVSAAAFTSSGNRFLVSPEHIRDLRAWLLERNIDHSPEHAEKRRACLASHVVSEKASALLDAGDLEAFIRQREADLNALEQAFVERHLAILDAGTSSPSAG
jgi:hypothetical protein